jgi:endo-1,4-beta-xylanase
LALAGCPQPNDDTRTTFIPVSNISGVPAETMAGDPLTLGGTVEPENADHTAIVWSISDAGTTGAVIEDGVLTATAAGTVTVTATIAGGLASGDYTLDFNITVTLRPPVGVSTITNIPASMMAGAPLTLEGVVEPENADHTTIVWSVRNAGTTAAVISEGNILNAPSPGTVTVRAAIAGGRANGTDYTQDFAITVLFEAVTGISGVPTAMIAGIPLTLNGTVEPEDAGNATIVWSIGNPGTTGASISEGNILNASAPGTLTLRATIAGGNADGTTYTQDFDINVSFKGVSGISGIPEAMIAGIPLTLSGAVKPEDASNKTILWSVGSPGTTGASMSGGNILSAAAAGMVTVRATIAGGNADGTAYTRDFDINVSFKGVSGISGIPEAMIAGIPLTLNGTVDPEDASNKTILWSIENAGTTGATISGGNILNAVAAGTVTLRATIAGGNADGTAYTRDFDISVTFKAVSGISGIPAAMVAGTPLTLNGAVEPEDASNKTIVWSMGNAGTTGASISDGNILNAATGGTVTLRATIAGGNADGTTYTRDFNISVTFREVTGISDIPTAMVAGNPLTLNGAVEPADATNSAIVWSIDNAGTTGASISGMTLSAGATGTVTLTATILNGLSTGNYTQDFTINVTFKEVTGISGLPGTIRAGEPLTLRGTVAPANASNRTIVWSIDNAGTTGASISGSNILNAPFGGTLAITASIAGGNADGTAYTQGFSITVTFTDVTNISGPPATVWAGDPLTLTGTVDPADATNKTIAWSVINPGTTGASISGGNILNTTAGGQLTVRATIVNGLSTGDYTQDFVIAANIPPGTLAIRVGFNRGIEITGSDGVNIIRKSASGSLTLSVESAAGYSDVAWYVDGGAAPVATGGTFALNAADYAAQIHSVTFTGKKSGTPYSKVIPFTVLD